MLPDGRGRIRSSLKRLEGLGYVKVIQDRNAGGRFKKNMLIVNADDSPPISENPQTVNPQTEKRPTEKGAQYKNYDTRTNNKTINDISGSSLPDGQEGTARRKEKRKNAFMDFQQREYPPEFYEDLEAKLTGLPAKEE